MAEEELEGLDDIDSLLDEGGGDADAGGDDFAGELDDFLSDDAGGDEGMGDEGGGDSELDSFFEDLSTIDDLEVIQDEESPAEDEPADEPESEEEEEVAAAPEPKKEKAKKEKKPKVKKDRSFRKKMIKYLILLGIFGGGGYYGYSYYQEYVDPQFLSLENVKSFSEDLLKEEPPPEVPPPAPPEPPPAPVVVKPSKPAPPPPGAPAYRVQVATCFFASCADEFTTLLKRKGRNVYFRNKKSKHETLEIISKSYFDTRQSAEELSTRINHEHRLEGQAFIIKKGRGYLISMGTFPDLSRANNVKDNLNQQFAGEVVFGTTLKTVPYKLKRVLTGRFATRRQGLKELRRVRRLDKRLKGAFLVRF